MTDDTDYATEDVEREKHAIVGGEAAVGAAKRATEDTDTDE